MLTEIKRGQNGAYHLYFPKVVQEIYLYGGYKRFYEECCTGVHRVHWKRVFGLGREIINVCDIGDGKLSSEKHFGWFIRHAKDIYGNFLSFSSGFNNCMKVLNCMQLIGNPNIRNSLDLEQEEFRKGFSAYHLRVDAVDGGVGSGERRKDWRRETKTKKLDKRQSLGARSNSTPSIYFLSSLPYNFRSGHILSILTILSVHTFLDPTSLPFTSFHILHPSKPKSSHPSNFLHQTFLNP